MTLRLALPAVLAVAAIAASCGGGEAEPAPDGHALYAQYCALCHGENGEGYAADQANALANQDFLALASDDFLRASIARGRPGTPMSAWGEERGGPLDAAEIDAVVAHLRGAQTVPSVDASAVPVGPGKPQRGEAPYQVYCAECHGDQGQGGTYLSIANPELLAVAADGYLRHVIEHGRGGTAMPAFGGTLTSQAIDDLVALIRSWQKPVDGSSPDLPSKDLGDPTLNPSGPEPDFPEGRFVSVAELKAAYDAKARMVLLDARPPSDYVSGHIPGAVSVPFYAVAEYLDQLPDNEWIVAYCACPHAESGAAADALADSGYTKVRVLDEGLPLWKELGYPIATGPTP